MEADHRQFSQAELYGAILKALDDLGVKTVNAREANAVIRAADEILSELRQPQRDAAPGVGVAAWLRSDDTGQSSRYVLHVLAPLAGLGQVHNPRVTDDPHAHPYDPCDFRRCVKLLEAVPALRPHLRALGHGHGPVWERLVADWEELESLYREELPSGGAPKLYARMLAIREAALRSPPPQADSSPAGETPP